MREHWKKEFKQLPESLSAGVASRSKVLVTKKLELLVLLNQLEIVEKNVWRVARPLRLKFQSIILNWRKHLGLFGAVECHGRVRQGNFTETAGALRRARRGRC